MRRIILTLLTFSSVAAIQAAHAQDSTQDILNQPSMSSFEFGRRSAPPVPVVIQETVTKVETAPVESAPKKETTPEPVAAKPAQPGQNLSDILAKAYTDSPFLRAEREVLRQQYENVALAESNRRPVVTADGGIAWVNAETDPGTRDSFTSTDGGITATQFLYRGGRTLAEIEQQLRLSDAAMAAYDNVTQQTFLNVVTAAMDIQRDRATIDLTEQNRKVIARALETAQHGFDVGELTRTDVAQAKARLAGADAQLVAAKADYSSALARFAQYAGQNGENLTVDSDISVLPAPGSLSAAQAQGHAEHPAIRTAIEVERASQSAIRAAQGLLLPSVYAQGTLDKAWNPSAILDESQSAAIGVRASLPLYDGGASRAQIRQAKYAQAEKQNRIEDAERLVEQEIATAWNDYQASLSQIAARGEQVDAATMARAGVYKEREVGTRTVLDTLNADAELLDAQVGQVQAQRDAVVAGYALMAATGQLTGEKLGLFSVDSEKQKVRATQHRWLGTSIDSSN